MVTRAPSNGYALSNGASLDGLSHRDWGMNLRVITAGDVYRIAKDRIDVTLTMVGGEEMRGHIFVQPPTHGHSGHDEPAALFNNPDPFFPFELPSGEVLLLSKARVAEVSGLPLDDDDAILRASTPMALLEVTLGGGVSRFGSMRLEVRADRPRLLDLLNESPRRFLALYTDHGMRLMNRALIECVRPLD